MRSYEAARTYFSILGFLSWCVIVLGGIVAMVAMAAINEMSRSFGGSPVAGLTGLLPGLAMMFAGFLGLVFVQIGRAGVDTAEYTQQMLKISRDQLEVSKKSLTASKATQSGLAALRTDTAERSGVSFADGRNENAGKSLPPDAQKVIEYRGREIHKRNDKYFVDGVPFLNLSFAQGQIDELISGQVQTVRTAEPS